ncbi:hypothetical protein VNO78_21667 [Psophocarpus tetragonolobus]|uniref:Legume lectin domain-containing protein n=1 Tax=Psophocarpus tetragonolobus TaxID=3891 RepID=A0AAN9XID6_PSOTE
MGTWNFRKQNVIPYIELISLTLLLALNKVNTESEAFSFNHFKPGITDPDLILQGDTRRTQSGLLQLTKVDQNGIPIWNSTGRAIYADPFHVWDSTTGNVASFETRFAFSINQTHPIHADGFVFFMAHRNSKPGKGGGNLGLFDSSEEHKSYQTLAIEFDTFRNSFDPPQVPHIGIDVNSIRSIKTHPFHLHNGQVARVAISYDAFSKILYIALVYPPSGTIYHVTHIVDLKEVLPEWIDVGFSASSGLTPNAAETHDIYSWYFCVSLPEDTDEIAASKNNPFKRCY